MLNKIGYGVAGRGLQLNIVYNPAGAFLPASQTALEKEFKDSLKKDFGIDLIICMLLPTFLSAAILITCCNQVTMKNIWRSLSILLIPLAAANVMCRNTISVGWDGCMYDCDFNQMLELKVNVKGKHISQYNQQDLNERSIIVNQHCYGCTAGAGSSCGGAVA